jgi:hypothetical protein
MPRANMVNGVFVGVVAFSPLQLVLLLLQISAPPER